MNRKPIYFMTSLMNSMGISTSVKLCVGLTALCFLANCTIYRSPERKEFESAAPQFRAQNLKQVGCSNSSQRSKATAKRLITIYKTGPSSESQFLWEYIIDDQSYFESDNLHGQYCEFENT